MNSLEFINREIEYYKQKKDKAVEWYAFLIEHHGSYAQINRAEEERDAINNYLDNLQQIQAELEAWYVVKPNLRFEEHSHAWIYLDRISKDHPSYRIIEKELLKNNIRSTTVVIKEGNKITVRREEVKDNG